MKYDPLSRRHFLQGLGGFTLSLPFLPSLLTKALAAEAGSPNIRFINVWQGNGNIASRFFPNNLNMSSFSGGQKGILSSRAGSISEILGSPFSNLKKKMIVASGMNVYYGAGHNPAITLCGHGRLDDYGENEFNSNSFLPWASIDQILARSNKIYQTAPRLRSLHLKTARLGVVGPGDRPDTVSFVASGQKLIEVPHDRDPRLKFDLLFGGSTTPTPSGPSPSQLKNKKVVDKTLADYKKLLNHRRISSVDKLVLKEHINHLSELEERLRGLQGGGGGNPAPSCTAPVRPSGPEVSYDQLSSFMSMNIDLIVAAIKCGHTKVATLMLNRAVDFAAYPFLANAPKQITAFHDETHKTTDSAYLRDIHKFFAGKAAELATKLDVVEDSTTGATYLDNSIIYFGNCMSDAQEHSTNNLPVVILGSGGGKLKTDQYIKYNDQAYSQLLVTIMRAMGLSPSEFRFNNQDGYGEYLNKHKPSNDSLSEFIA